METNLIHYTSQGWLIKFQKSTHEDYKIRCMFVTPDGKASFGGNGNTMIEAFSAAERKAFSMYESADRVELSKAEYDTIVSHLHSLQAHPHYDYTTTTCARKSLMEPPAGEGWEVNKYKNDGHERFEFHDEAYWMRKKNETES